MKKGLLFVALICILLSCLPVSYAEIIINEVELNPAGEDRGNEWIELYSSEQVSVDGWKLMSSNGRNFSLSFSFSGYYSFITATNFLTNDKNTLRLMDASGETIFSTKEISDSVNNDKTWQYCSGEWVFETSTRDSENNCPTKDSNIAEDEKTEEDTKDEKVETTQSDEDDNTNINSADHINSENMVSDEVIILSSKASIENSDRIIYKSRKEYIKEYSIYGFLIFCIMLLCLLFFRIRREARIKRIEDE